MNTIYNNYLTPVQYNKICKYWRYINKVSCKLENFDYSQYKYYHEYADDEETITECINYNNEIYNYREKLKGKLIYYQKEYEKYINSIGFELINRTYDEILFNLLNDGIVLD